MFSILLFNFLHLFSVFTLLGDLRFYKVLDFKLNQSQRVKKKRQFKNLFFFSSRKFSIFDSKAAFFFIG